MIFLLACIPDLHSPEGAEPEGLACGETLPENAWPSTDPPDDLVSEGFAVGDILPDACMGDQNAQQVDLWQFYGQVWVLDISTMWCSPCRELAETLEEVVADYEAEGFVYVTVLPQDTLLEVPDTDDLNVWGDSYGITSPILADAEGWSYQVVTNNSFPVILVIDRDMTVAEKVSPISDEAIRIAVEKVL